MRADAGPLLQYARHRIGIIGAARPMLARIRPTPVTLVRLPHPPPLFGIHKHRQLFPHLKFGGCKHARPASPPSQYVVPSHVHFLYFEPRTRIEARDPQAYPLIDGELCLSHVLIGVSSQDVVPCT